MFFFFFLEITFIWTEKPTQSDWRSINIWVKIFWCCFQPPKELPHCKLLAARLFSTLGRMKLDLYFLHVSKPRQWRPKKKTKFFTKNWRVFVPEIRNKVKTKEKAQRPSSAKMRTIVKLLGGMQMQTIVKFLRVMQSNYWEDIPPRISAPLQKAN